MPGAATCEFLAACSAAAAELGLGLDVTAEDDWLVRNRTEDPPGCYIRVSTFDGQALMYNSGLDNTGTCSVDRKCVCGTSACLSCRAGRYAADIGHIVTEYQAKDKYGHVSDPAYRNAIAGYRYAVACKGGRPCRVGRFGPLGSTSADAATCTDCPAGHFSGNAPGAGECKKCPLGSTSVAGAADSVCRLCVKGWYRAPLTLRRSGSCSVRPRSLIACSAAAAELGLLDVTAENDGSPVLVGFLQRATAQPDRPPGCYIHGGGLYYDSGRENTGSCSNLNECVCGEISCVKCVSEMAPPPVTKNPSESTRSYSSIWANSAKGTGYAASKLDSHQGWSSRHNSVNSWMQIDLGSVQPVSGAVVQKRRCGNECQYVKSLKFQVSSDGRDFVNVDNGTVFTANAHGEDQNYKKVVEFRSSVAASEYLNFNPKSSNVQCSLNYHCVCGNELFH
eukprot:g8026.t1